MRDDRLLMLAVAVIAGVIGTLAGITATAGWFAYEDFHGGRR